MPLPPFPLVNGNRFDYSSIEVMVNGVPYRGVKSIDYSDSLEPSKQYGTSAGPIGRTRGKWDGEASLEIYKEDAATLRTALAATGLGGYGEANFLVLVTYSEVSSGQAKTDTLLGCRIKKISDSHTKGNEGLTEKWDLDLMGLLRDGVSILSVPATVK